MTFTQLQLGFRRLSQRMWFKATLYALLGFVTALIGTVSQSWIPEHLAGRIGADSVGNLLSILASSMLAVTTFSLGTMVSAFSAAANGATPRATSLLIADDGAQRSLATFIGAFIFSIVGLIALSTGLYGDSGRVVLFISTILVIALITATLLRWIQKLSTFGRLGNTITMVEAATQKAMLAHLDDPLLGAALGINEQPPQTREINSKRIAFVTHIDVERLNLLAVEHGLRIHVAIRPGCLVMPGRPLAWISGAIPSETLEQAICQAFDLADEREYEFDPRFGFVVLTEVATRGLSPATNDVGTPIAVLHSLTRLLCQWASSPSTTDKPPRFPHVTLPALKISDLFNDIFPPIARDGAGLFEVAIRLQKCLSAIASSGHSDFRREALIHSEHALKRAEATMSFEEDKNRLREETRRLQKLHSPL